MNTRLLIFLLLWSSLSCNQKNDDNKSEDKSLKKKFVLISSGQMSEAKLSVIHNCEFELVIRNNDTIYLATKDSNYITPEKYKVGTSLSQLPTKLQESIQKENGWGYYILLNSEWNLGFCEGISCTEKPLTNSSEVKWIFRRK